MRISIILALAVGLSGATSGAAQRVRGAGAAAGISPMSGGGFQGTGVVAGEAAGASSSVNFRLRSGFAGAVARAEQPATPPFSNPGADAGPSAGPGGFAGAGGGGGCQAGGPDSGSAWMWLVAALWPGMRRRDGDAEPPAST